jgi:glycosyltransferase involved in cell wall biosynthesis
VLLIVPESWPGPDDLHPERFEILEVPMRLVGNVNAHFMASPRLVSARLAEFGPDVVDIHAEPFSVVTRQVLGLIDRRQTAVGYTAQNLDKRFPPPFAHWERRALGRLAGLYPCSSQAASVAVGKGFHGALQVLPLGVDPVMAAGSQDLPDQQLNLLLVGRLVQEKGIADAVHTLAALRRELPTTLTLVGEGPAQQDAVRRARELGVADCLRVEPWVGARRLAAFYREAHIVLVPSLSTPTWVEQFGRVVVEAQASGAVVVAYASGSLPEVVGDAGVVVREGAVDDLATATSALVADPDRWRSLRRLGLERARTSTWDQVARRQLDLFDEAITVGHSTRPARSDRLAAVRAFGPPARPADGLRPFATPWPKAGSTLGRVLGRAVDHLAR